VLVHPTSRLDESAPGVSSTEAFGERFGHALATRDDDQDGRDDLVVENLFGTEPGSTSAALELPEFPIITARVRRSRRGRTSRPSTRPWRSHRPTTSSFTLPTCRSKACPSSWASSWLLP